MYYLYALVNTAIAVLPVSLFALLFLVPAERKRCDISNLSWWKRPLVLTAFYLAEPLVALRAWVRRRGERAVWSSAFSGQLRREIVSYLLRTTAIVYAVSLAYFYFFVPALTGAWGGWDFAIFLPVMIGGLSALFAWLRIKRWRASSQSWDGPMAHSKKSSSPQTPPSEVWSLAERKAGAWVCGLALVVLLFGSLLIVAVNTWGNANAHRLAALPRIVKAATLPQTDVNHLVLVTQAIAEYESEQALGANGQNLGSVYHTEQGDFTLQAIRYPGNAPHLYWVAPLSYNSSLSYLASYDSQGVVIVNAEVPCGQGSTAVNCAQVVTSLHIRISPQANWGQNLYRHLYDAGWRDGTLDDATLELDDSLRPFWTVAYDQPSQITDGNVVTRLLVVDATSGDIASYTPGRAPSRGGPPDWIDRVIPAPLAIHYTELWGLYGDDRPWFNLTGAGQQKPAVDQPELLYNTADHPVYLVPMSSISNQDNSSTGFVLFSSQENQATVYPVYGISIGQNVNTAFQTTAGNVKGYRVSTPQLYLIDGEVTYLAVYYQPQDSATPDGPAVFQGVGLLDAHAVSGANVQMVPTIGQALSNYQFWVAEHRAKGTGPSSSSAEHIVSGTILRIDQVVIAGQATYSIILQGDLAHQYQGLGSGLSSFLVNASRGDSVTIKYDDLGGPVYAMVLFRDDTLQGVDPALKPDVTSGGHPIATPTSGPTPTSTPKASPTP